MKKVLQAVEEAKQAGRHCVVLISYPSIRSAFSNHSPFLSLHFHTCVLDEGHFIRNHTSLLHQAVCAVRANHRVVLSGTPVQNYLDDVFGIFGFIVPDYFPDYDHFFEYYVRPISASFGSKSREVQMRGGCGAGDSRAANERIEELNQAIAPFLLRRTKEEVKLAIPEKMIDDIVCPLSDCQRAVLVFPVRHHE